MLNPLFSLVEPLLLPPLLSDDYRARLALLSSGLPIEGNLGLECRLGADAGRVDLSQAFRPDSIARIARRTPQDSAGHDRCLWQELCRRWIELDFKGLVRPRHLWFEYDLDRPCAATLAQPSVFLEPERDAGRLDHGAWFRTLAALGDLLELPGGIPASEPMARAAARIPEDFMLGTCGYMLSRSPPTVRVLVKAPSMARAGEFLEAQGLGLLPGLLEDVSRRDAALVLREPVLSLDFGENFSARLGLELKDKDAADNAPATALLDRLVTLGLCSTAKREALKSFPVVIDPEVGLRWPEPFLVDALLAPENRFSRIVGKVHHYKLLFQPGQEPEAKAYLGFSHVLQELPGG